MTPYYERDGITIFHADCRELLAGMEAGSVDAVVTDPPYGVAYSTGRRAADIRSSTRIANDHLLAPLLGDAVEDLAPLLGDAGVMYCFAAPERLDDVIPIIRKRMEVANLLVWDKGNCTAGDLETTYGQQWEACIYARKSRVSLLGGRDRDIIRISRGNTHSYEHPTQKPVELMEYLIGRHAADTILDPFAGSCTTGVAAWNLGRKAILCEISEEYCEIGAKRLDRVISQGRLFKPEPVQETQRELFADAE